MTSNATSIVDSSRRERPWEPAPPYPAVPASAVGRKVADVLAALRAQRGGSTRKQVADPRKARKRREGGLSLTEFAERIGLGPRVLRRKLLEAGILQIETEVRNRGNAAAKYLRTARLTTAAIEDGLGRRLEPSSGVPYDVLTSKGQEWVVNQLRQMEDQKAERKPNRRHEVREEVRQLLGQGKTQAEIARMIGLSRQLVSHHARKLAA